MPFLILAASLLLAGAAFAQVSVDISASPSSGTAPLTTTLAWTSSGASSCVAADGWSGTKPTSGSQVISGISSTTTYTLVCTSGEGAVVLSWTPPTTNTDGSALTDLANYLLFYAPTSAEVPGSLPVDVPLGSSFTINLPPGTWFFGLKAVNSGGQSSAMSNIVSKTVPGDQGGDSVTVSISAVPSMVTGGGEVMELRLHNSGNWLVRRVGFIAAGEPCLGSYPLLVAPGDDWWRVPMLPEYGITHPKSRAVARCVSQ